MRFNLILLFLVVLLTASVSAINCDLEVSLLNQDPYPAVPGDYVQIVFQINGMESPECGDVSIELLETYPLRFDPNFSSVQSKKAGTFTRGFSSNWIVPYNVRIDPEAIDGDTDIEVLLSTRANSEFKQIKTFQLNIEEVRADFSVFIRSYDYSSKKLTLEVLNTAKNDIKSLVLSIPSQNNIKILGGNKNIVGDLDSKDYTSTDFTAIPKDGNITLDLEYTDKIGERRRLSKEIVFDSDYFEHTKPSNSVIIRNITILLVIIGAFFLWRFLKKKKKINF